MELSKKLDQFLIYEAEKLNARLALLSLLVSPFLYWILNYFRYDLEISTKLNLSVVIYISTLSGIYNLQILIVRKVLSRIRFQPRKLRIPLKILKWFSSFALTGYLQYQLIYIPILHYRPPTSVESLAITTLLYAVIATMVFESFRLEIEKQKT